MLISNQLLHQIADPTLPRDERARLRCKLAKELEDIGNYDAAREVMDELWPRFGESPVLDDLQDVTAAEVLLRTGVLTGWITSVRQIGEARETAKNLIKESITRFESSRCTEKVAEAQMELGHCYWREGAFNEARVWLQESLSLLPNSAAPPLRAITMLRLATVESSARRLSDALRISIEAAPLFEESANHTLRGKFHNEFGFVLRNLGAAERRDD